MHTFTGHIRANAFDCAWPPCPVSSRKTMPVCSTASMALGLDLFLVDQLAGFLLAYLLQRVPDRQPDAALFAAPILLNMFCNWLVISSIPGGAMISTPTGAVSMSISISLSSSSPSRSFFAEDLPGGGVTCRHGLRCRSAAKPTAAGSGSRASRIRSSATSSRPVLDLGRVCCSRSILTDASARSRTMDSTSRPT